MKHTFKASMLFTAALALTPGLSQASDDFAAGELALVFYSITPPEEGAGAGVFGTEYYVFNLGPASSFRENTQNNVSVKTVNNSISSNNIAADLSSVFGPSWASSGTVRMMVVSTIPQEGTLTNGDPTRTIYYSMARNSLNTGDKGADPTTLFPPIVSGLRIQSSNSIKGFLYTGTNTFITTPGQSTSGANVSGVRLTTSNANDLSDYVPPASGSTYFLTGTDPTAILGSGTLSGTAGVEAAVDVFRVLNTATNADLTSGSSTGNAVVGEGQFIGSITIDSSGNVKVQAVGVATGTYATWAATNGVTGGTTGDSDHDGISNLVEYALALNPAGSDGSAGTFSGGAISFTKRAEAVTNNDVTYTIQESDDLGLTDPWENVTPTTNTTSAITYNLPSGGAKKFARLVVKTTP